MRMRIILASSKSIYMKKKLFALGLQWLMVSSFCPTIFYTSTSAIHFSGNGTPEELAKTLLICVRDNDKSTWIKYIHPSSPTKDRFIQRFAGIRQHLVDFGFKDWKTMKFKDAKVSLNSDPIALTKDVVLLDVEFTYGPHNARGRICLDNIKPEKGDYYMYFQHLCDQCAVFFDDAH
jgi:hypothetical protein